MNDPRHAAVVSGLCSTEELQYLYLTSATFRYQIDALAVAIPLMVEGLATKAREFEALVNNEISRLIGRPWHD